MEADGGVEAIEAVEGDGGTTVDFRDWVAV